MPRAAALSPEARRETLIAATLPLLSEHGRAVTTRQIAAAAGVAEGTIFRVFDSKEELVGAAIQEAFKTDGILGAIENIDPGLALRERLLAVVGLMQVRLASLFSLMDAVGVVGPPPHHDDSAADLARAQMQACLLRLVEPDAACLTVPPDRLLALLRMLTFSATHRKISDGLLLTPTEIVDTVLFGVSRKEGNH